MARRNKTKELLSAFGDRYITFENNGGYCLYDKETPSKRSNFTYLGKFYISTDKTKYIFNDNPYDDVNSLILAMKEYNNTLPFSTDVYDPNYRKHCHIEYALHDYLASLGFKMDWEHMEATYSLDDMYGDTICCITFEVKEDTTEGSVTKIINRKDKYTLSRIDIPFTDLDSAIGACNSLLSMYVLQLTSKTMSVLNNMTKSRASSILIKTFDMRTLTEYTENEKQHVIEYLEKELEQLKNN